MSKPNQGMTVIIVNYGDAQYAALTWAFAMPTKALWGEGAFLFFVEKCKKSHYKQEISTFHH